MCDMVRHHATLCDKIGENSATMIYKKVCLRCGKEFTARKSTTQYCSHKCANSAYKLKLREETKALVEQRMGIIREERKEASSPEIMTAQLAAEYLGVHRSTIYRYMENGLFKGTTLPGKTLIRKSDLEHFLESSEGYVRHERPPKEQISEYITMKETAEKYGISPAGAYKILKENNVPIARSRGKVFYSLKHVERIFKKRQAESHPEISEWYTSAEIQEKYGMTEVAVWSMVYDYGIPKKRVNRVSYYSKMHVDTIKTRGGTEESPTYTVEECMQKYSFTREQVYYYLKYHNIPRVKTGKCVKFRKDLFDQIFTPIPP